MKKEKIDRKHQVGLPFFFAFPFLLKNPQINGLVSPFVFPEKQQHTDKELFSKLSSPVEYDSIQIKWSVLSMG